MRFCVLIATKGNIGLTGKRGSLRDKPQVNSTFRQLQQHVGSVAFLGKQAAVFKGLRVLT